MLKPNQIGVALTKRACFTCGKIADAEIVMNTVVDKVAAERVNKMNGAVIGWFKEPCKECQEHMQKGIIIVTIDPKLTTDKNNPHRTGGFFLVTEDYIKRIVDTNKELLTDILKKRYTFMEHQVAEAFGFFNKEITKNEDKQTDHKDS